ncbi:MAG: nicotinate-nucleotide adenylyltransferase [Candidatus Fluviicola riflensis]|nr:MAG: nicotinate-nucleotide adenylyltransferase [Candidatus Fluviicola riflensis]OGS76932.1 MAG: nicotinate-nucleotide adenylyltransferase [Candidatus Fluviicola riflensis]OGS81861.1 MAG: nicotinate-nucleotide adenylyltransferase [Fluviicola sp. RIFCSPHIGHO2_01_FULL_43_53]OGS88660.1 MAG: nicotinate-nucleotide adenylyltransferase [Fluviicola sp. RIFCSPHIGHO2_12_FULL_43_24]
MSSMVDERRLTTEEKALKINLTGDIYGCFAEIGAGQEVAANFFKAGGSSGTIAYTQSAYDMKVSDAMYGPASRYVCEERLTTMLQTEYETLSSRLPKKKEESRFFAFSNTVEALNYHKTNQGHGWVGIRFQMGLGGEPNDVILHIKLHDNSHKAQQEALGILGVNLIHACYFHTDDLDEFLTNLVHRIPRDRVEVDMLRVSGPDFDNVDNRIIALNLVKRGMTDATMFDLCGSVLQPATALYKKNILLMRGRFRPVTKVHIDMIETGSRQFLQEEGVSADNLSVIFELTLKDLTADGKISDKDFIDRAELLGSLGYTVMISNYLKHYKMVDYLAGISRGQKMGLIVGVYNLHTIFDERYYDNLPGGLLEAFGRGFGHNIKLFVYPATNVDTGELYTLENIQIPVHLRGLLQYMVDNNKMEAILDFDPRLLHILSDEVLSKIKAHAHSWENDVPEDVVKAIKYFELFGYVKRKEVVSV